MPCIRVHFVVWCSRNVYIHEQFSSGAAPTSVCVRMCDEGNLTPRARQIRL